MNIRSMKITFKGVIFALSCIFLLSISCKKDETPSTPVSIFLPDQYPTGTTLNDSTKTDSTGIEVGLKFRSTVAVTISGMKYFRTPGNFGYHIGQLYSMDRTLLASQMFTNETDSGWQTVMFTSPVAISPNTTFIAAYFSSLGFYVSNDYKLNRSITNGTLSILPDGADGPNGVYSYTNSPAFPDSGYQSTNYWIDVIEKK